MEAYPKLSVLMACAHEPSADPRIRWEAEHAAAEFNVTVLGFGEEKETTISPDSPGAYRVVRLKRQEVSGLWFFLRWFTVLPLTDRLLGLGLAIISRRKLLSVQVGGPCV